MWKEWTIFRAAVWQIFVEKERVKGAEGLEEECSEGVVEVVENTGASGVQQERISIPASCCGGGMPRAEFIGISVEQQLCWGIGLFGGGNVLEAEADSRGVSQQPCVPMTLSRFFSGTGLVGRSQCFCENIGMFINAV